MPLASFCAASSMTMTSSRVIGDRLLEADPGNRRVHQQAAAAQAYAHRCADLEGSAGRYRVARIAEAKRAPPDEADRTLESHAHELREPRVGQWCLVDRDHWSDMGERCHARWISLDRPRMPSPYRPGLGTDTARSGPARPRTARLLVREGAVGCTIAESAPVVPLGCAVLAASEPDPAEPGPSPPDPRWPVPPDPVPPHPVPPNPTIPCSIRRDVLPLAARGRLVLAMRSPDAHETTADPPAPTSAPPARYRVDQSLGTEVAPAVHAVLEAASSRTMRRSGCRRQHCRARQPTSGSLPRSDRVRRALGAGRAIRAYGDRLLS